MYTHIYPAKVLYIHNPKYFYLKTEVWPDDLHYKTNLNLALETELWEDWDVPDRKAQYVEFLVKSLRNKIVFVEVTAGTEMNPKPIANMYIPTVKGKEQINSHAVMIYPHFLEHWKNGVNVVVDNLCVEYRM
jgi:hypothetical protein